MALTKTADTPTTTVDAVKTVGSFEAMDEATAAKPAANDPAPVAAPAAEVVAPKATTTAVAPSNKAAASQFAQEVQAMKGDADFSYGIRPTFKAINGVIKGTGDNTASMGVWIHGTMIAWNDRTQISPGVDTDNAKLCVAYSQDHVTIDNVIGVDKYGSWIGRKVAEYVEFLKESDFPKAAASRFIDIAFAVRDAEKQAGKAMIGEVITVSLSKSSIPSFSQYQDKLNMAAKMITRGIPGIVLPADPFTFYMIAEAASKDGRDWTKIKVSDKLNLPQ